MDNSKKAVIYAVTACLIWGTVYVAIRSGLNHGMRPLTFAGVRFLSGGVILLIIARALGRLKLSRRDFVILSVFGLVQTGVQNALFFTGVDRTNAGVSAIFINTQPFFVILLAPLFFKASRITLPRLAGAAVGFGGVVLTSYRHVFVSPGYELGILALLVSAISWAVSNIIAKKLMENRDALTFTAVQMAVGAVPLLLAGFILEGDVFTHVDTTGFLILGYLVFFATAIPFFAWFKALQLGEVGRVSVFTFSLPVLGVFSGWLILGEGLDANILIGMAMVAAGIITVNRG
jgi:O-acetylserine/cysteine efflux transporter